MALFIFIYGAVIASTGPSAAPLARGWRPSRRVIVVLIVAVVALIALALYVGGIE